MMEKNATTTAAHRKIRNVGKKVERNLNERGKMKRKKKDTQTGFCTHRVNTQELFMVFYLRRDSAAILLHFTFTLRPLDDDC